MKQLAIKGHPTRGKEVIEILEMLGGRNLHLQSGCGNGIYLINTCDNIIYFNQPKDIIYDFIILTLEEFLEKFPYKVGDKVIIEKYDQIFEILSVRWCTEINIIMYQTSNGWYCADKLQPYKEETVEVSEEFYNKYCVNCGSQRCTAEGEWLEGCEHYKEETMNRKYNIEEYLEVWKETENGLEVVVNDNFELKEDNGKFYIIKKQPQYPKTCGECCDVLKIPNDERYIDIDVPLDYNKLLYAFTELLICRDAYWKIAGEEMGLDKPWKPDTCQIVYSIGRDSNKIGLCNNMFGGYFILEFPTEEMRDAFCENFRDLIELCKELL